MLEWEDRDGEIVVRRVGKYTFEDIRRRLFPDGPPAPKTVDEMDEGIRREIRRRYARHR